MRLGLLDKNRLKYPEGGGGVLPMMTYTGRLCLKGVSFSGFKYMKGQGFHLLKYINKE